MIPQSPRAVVTGASSGIGKALAEALAARGYDVTLVARREEKLKDLKISLEKAYPKQTIDTVVMDLNQDQSAETLFEKVVTANPSKPVHLLVNNAGVGDYGPLLEYPFEQHKRTFNLNTLVPIELTQVFTKHMLDHGEPSAVIQVASIASFLPMGNFAIYSASKAALRAFTETLQDELRGTNVQLQCLCPGGTYTEFLDHSGQELKTFGKAGMMSPEKVAQLCLRDLDRGKLISIPGLMNWLLCSLERLLPRRWSIWLASRVMEKSVNRVPPAHRS